MAKKEKRKKQADEPILYQQYKDGDEIDDENDDDVTEDLKAKKSERVKTISVLVLIAGIIGVIILFVSASRGSIETTEVVYKDAIESERVYKAYDGTTTHDIEEDDESPAGAVAIKELLQDEDIDLLYEMAVEEGFTGTREEFYALLMSHEASSGEINNALQTSNRDYEELKKALSAIGLDIAELAKKNKEMEILISQLKSSSLDLANMSHEEILNHLSKLGIDLSALSNKSREDILKALLDSDANAASMTDKIKSELEQLILKSNFDYSYLDNSFLDQQNNLENHFSDLTNNLSNLTTYIDNSFINQGTDLDGINGKLDLLFLSVSSGKTAIAASLLTGASVAERNSLLTDLEIDGNNPQNVNFTQFAKAIADGDNAIAIGKSDIAEAIKRHMVPISNAATFTQLAAAIDQIQCLNPACGLNPNVIYTHHYHTTTGTAGTDIENAIADSHTQAVAGGCFANPVYHVHSGSSTSGGGCHTINNSHWHGEAGSSGCWRAEGRRCSACSFSTSGTAECPTHGSAHLSTRYILECTRTEESSFSIGCGKTTSTIDLHIRSCGKIHGQIVEAKIVY